MNVKNAVKEACQQPTLVDALAWIAVWECERAVAQAREFDKAGISTAGSGGQWDTVFKTCFESVMEEFGRI